MLYFGTYDRSYPRNAQVISCLRRAGVEVQERHRDVWGRSRHNYAPGIRQLARLARAELALGRRRGDTAEALLVGYPGHPDLPSARRVAAGRPIVLNPLVSLHDTLVADRRRFRAGGLPARVLRRVDAHAFRAADLVVADTDAHAAFFRRELGLEPERVESCFVGAEERLFRPRPQAPSAFHVLFVGKLIPLHGVETILAAARLVPEIRFRIVGSGQLERLLERLPPNVERVPWVDYPRLPAELHAAGCALGVFGTSAKSARVIPNKAYQALACATPLVTADTPAARELLAHGVDALLVPAGDPPALADAVRSLADDAALAERLGRAGRSTYEARASERVLGARWRGLLERLLGRV